MSSTPSRERVLPHAGMPLHAGQAQGATSTRPTESLEARPLPIQGLQAVEDALVETEKSVLYSLQALRVSIANSSYLAPDDTPKFDSAKAAQKAMIDNLMAQVSSFRKLHVEWKEQALQMHSLTLLRTRSAQGDVSKSADLLQTAKAAAHAGMGEISQQLQSARETASREMRELEIEYMDAKQQHDKRLQQLRLDYSAQTAQLKAEQKKDLDTLCQDTKQLLVLQTKDATSEAKIAKQEMAKEVQSAKAELLRIRRHKHKTIIALQAAARGAGWACTAHERAEQRCDALQAALRRSRGREQAKQKELEVVKRDLQTLQAEHMRELVLNARSGVSSGELRRAQHEARAAQSSLEDTFGKLERTKELKHEMRQDISRLQQELTTCKRQLRSGRASRSGSAPSSPGADTMHLRKQLVDANASIRGLKKDTTRLQQELSTAHTQRAEAERRVQRVSASAGKLQQRLDLLKSAGATPAPPRSYQAAEDPDARILPPSELKHSARAAAAQERAAAALKAARWALALQKMKHLRQQRRWQRHTVRSAMHRWQLVATRAALSASRSDMRFAQLSGMLHSSRTATSTAAAGSYSPNKS